MTTPRTTLEVLSRLDFCLCGRSTQAWETLKEALCLFERPDASWLDKAWKARLADIRAWMKQSPAHNLVCYFLDALDLTEHGSQIDGAWLTHDGVLLLDHLRTHGCNPGDWPEELRP